MSLGGGTYLGGDGDGLIGAHGAKPAGGEPGLRNGEFGPATIEADADVGRGGHRRVAERAGAIAI